MNTDDNIEAKALALDMIVAGVARIVRSNTADLIEFAFNGIRYVVSNDDWTTVIKLIGMNNVEDAIKNPHHYRDNR